MHLQEIFIKAFKKRNREDDLQMVMQNYGLNEIDVPSSKYQLLPLPKRWGNRMQLSQMIVLFQKPNTIMRMLVTEVIELVKLMLIMLATNAVSERSFSSLKRIKT